MATAEQANREPTMAEVLAKLAAIQEANTKVQTEQLRQTRPRSNQVGPHISVFNPQGQKDYPMPELKCEVHMPFPQRPGLHGMDFEEVELMNLVEPGVYPIELNDGSEVKINVIGRKNTVTGVTESLTFSGPIDPDTGRPTPLFTDTNKQQFPQMRTMLRQMVGDAAESVLTMAQRKKKVAAFLAADDRDVAVKKGALPISRGE